MSGNVNPREIYIIESLIYISHSFGFNMSLTRTEWEEIWYRLKTIEKINSKVWKAKHYKWANNINWEVQRIKEKVQQVIGQME